jgi:hypothetical protein
MPTLNLGNASVVESYKPDPGTNETKLKRRKDLGQQVTTMQLNEVDGDDRPSRSMNLTLVKRFWSQHSDSRRPGSTVTTIYSTRSWPMSSAATSGARRSWKVG